LVAFYAMLLLPTQMTIGPLGGAGSPATLAGLLAALLVLDAQVTTASAGRLGGAGH
jgi:hypothetical protein